MRQIIIFFIIFVINQNLLGQKKEINSQILAGTCDLTKPTLLSIKQQLVTFPNDSSKPKGCYSHYYDKSPFIMTVGTRFSKMKFKNFQELDSSKINLLNKTEYYLFGSFSGYYHNIYLELGTSDGLLFYHKSDYTDSININLKASSTFLSLGYGMAFNKLRLILTPYFSFSRNYYRYTTYRKTDSITLSQYFNDDNYDLKFIQWIGILGGNFDFGHIIDKKEPFCYIDFGFGGGYLFKLSNKPLIKSAGNKISSSGNIDFSNLFLQVSLKIGLFRK
jgi:hypothetical protein